jgi:RNA polymerase sigma factor (sigma-70 family)
MSGDRDKVRELLEGGREAWDRFAIDYRLLIFKAAHTAARRFGAGTDDVEDTVHQVFVELLEDDAKVLKSYGGKSTFVHWLTVVAYRIAAREFTRGTRERPIDGEDRPAPSRPSDPDALAPLARLPERERRALILFHVEDQSYREIALALGVPSNQVGMVLLRAREQLAAILGKPVP